MTFVLIFFTAVALAMDALAVSIATGVQLVRVRPMQAFRMAACFGFFQAFMPALGWLLGNRVREYIEAYDHWLAFGLLFIIGAHMALEAYKALRENQADPGFCPVDAPRAREPVIDPTKGKTLVLLGIATSIDALAVGISFSMLQMTILVPVLLIGIITFAISYAGIFLGAVTCRNQYLSRYAGIAGGVVLILIGLNILREHGAFASILPW